MTSFKIYRHVILKRKHGTFTRSHFGMRELWCTYKKHISEYQFEHTKLTLSFFTLPIHEKWDIFHNSQKHNSPYNIWEIVQQSDKLLWILYKVKLSASVKYVFIFYITGMRRISVLLQNTEIQNGIYISILFYFICMFRGRKKRVAVHIL